MVSEHSWSCRQVSTSLQQLPLAQVSQLETPVLSWVQVPPK